MKPITIWERQIYDKKTKTKYWQHNHIEDGLKKGLYPLPIKPEFTLQKAWKNGHWIRKWGFLNKRYEVIIPFS